MVNFKYFGFLCITSQGALRRRFIYEPENSDFINQEEKKETANPDTWRGIFWNFEGKEILVSFDRGTYFGNYMSDETGKLLLIFDHRRSKIWQAPNNAIIYNADGSIHIILSPPELIGSIAAQYKKQDILIGQCFSGLLPGLYDNDKGEKVVGISILFPEGYSNLYGDFFEIREIDLETGEFGEVLQDGAV